MTTKSEAQENEQQQEHGFLLKDIQKAAKRAGGAKYLEASKEFSNEAYPLMIAIAEHFGERLQAVEAAVDELIDGQESMLQPDMAQQIMATLELGKVLATHVTRLEGGMTLDDASAKRLRSEAAAFLTACELTAEVVEEAAMPAGDDEDDEDGEDEEDVGGTEEEVTAQRRAFTPEAIAQLEQEEGSDE